MARSNRIETSYGSLIYSPLQAIPIHRVGYRPDPWAWTPWEYAGADGCFHGRWDDPNGTWRRSSPPRYRPSATQPGACSGAQGEAGAQRRHRRPGAQLRTPICYADELDTVATNPDRHGAPDAASSDGHDRTHQHIS